MVREEAVIHSGRLGTAAMELQGEGKGKACEGKKPRKVEMLGGENSQKTLEYIGDEGDNSNLFLRGGQGGALPCCRLWRLCCGWGAEGVPREHYKKASHHSRRHPKQSRDCLALAPHVSFSHSRKRSSSFFSTRNWPRTTYALSKPLSSSFLPRTSPIPARLPTGFSPMGSATKSRCFWEVVILIRFNRQLRLW